MIYPKRGDLIKIKDNWYSEELLTGILLSDSNPCRLRNDTASLTAEALIGSQKEKIYVYIYNFNHFKIKYWKRR